MDSGWSYWQSPRSLPSDAAWLIDQLATDEAAVKGKVSRHVRARRAIQNRVSFNYWSL